VADNNPVRAIEEPVEQIAREIVAGVAETASATAAFPQAAGQREEALLVAAPVDRAEPAQKQAVRAAHPAWGPVAVVDGVAAADGGSPSHRRGKANEKENYLDRLQRLCGLYTTHVLCLHCYAWARGLSNQPSRRRNFSVLAENIHYAEGSG
jgi:hypothetical protein